MVSFGEEKGAIRWLKENFPSGDLNMHMITDERRLLYHLNNIRLSFYRVWNTECLTYYAEQVSAGRELPSAYKDVNDDPHQMGGNFIVEFDNETAEFRLVYVYKSKTPNDRPSFQQLLQFLN